MTSAIPKPEFPTARRRRSSIGQGAEAGAGQEANADQAAAPNTQSAQTSQPSPPTTAEQSTEQLSAPTGAAATTQQPRPPSGAGGQSRGRSAATRTRGGAAKTAAAQQTPNKHLVGSKDILLSLPEDLKERMVNTITWTQPHTGIGQQQKFIRKAILDLCERLEQDFNQGDPFAPRVVPTDE